MANTLIGGPRPEPARPAGRGRPGGPAAPPAPARTPAISPGPPARTRSIAQRLRRIGPDWPFVVLLAGFPLWWALGVSEVIVFILAIPMALQLVGRRGIVVPRGFGWWMIFLFWLIVGAPLMFADAPSGISGGGGARAPIVVYRLAWYLSCTIVLLWIGNLDEKDLPSRKVVRLVGWMFVVTTAGGMLGVLLPHVEFTSFFESILPTGLARTDFVQSISHPQAASVQKLLGAADARPTAPFAYANTWGSIISITLPYFLIGWLGPQAGWRRQLAPLVLGVAMIPVIFSLNRGLWICLALGGVLLAIRLAFSGRVMALVALGLTIVLAGGLLLASPLGDTLVARLQNGKSNDRRGQLLTETVKNTIEASPVAGFASTRKVQGSFDSIAGGATPNCKACGVPPLGTQGHIWLVIFSQGIGGLIFFLAFFLRQFAAHWRSRTTLEAAGTIILIFYAVQMFIYDTLGWPLFLIMTAIALMWRERWRAEAAQESTRMGGPMGGPANTATGT